MTKSTVEDFENAPVGATATHKVTGGRAMKIDGVERLWVIPSGRYVDDESMEFWDYTLDPPAPTTAREALALAWELAHEVKPGQVIPKGTELLEFSSSGLKEYAAYRDFGADLELAPSVRTLEPLPEPEPDWLDAPAVMARVEGWVSCHDPQVFTRENKTGTQWVLDTKVYRWDELIDVIPLYPKGQDS